MKNIGIKLFSILIITAGIFSVFAEEGRLNNSPKNDANIPAHNGEFVYIIGPGDTLEIKVWRHPDLETKVFVRPDGQIALPLIGDMRASDLTPAQLKEKITVGLAKIINDPQVTVNVVGFYSKKIFVLGEVKRPGVYPFAGRVSVLEAVSMASGYNEDTAFLKGVILIRRNYGRKPEALRVNLWEVITKAKVSQDILLEPGDIVFVPKSFIAKLDTFIDQFFAKTDPVLQYYLDILDINRGGRQVIE